MTSPQRLSSKVTFESKVHSGQTSHFSVFSCILSRVSVDWGMFSPRKDSILPETIEMRQAICTSTLTLGRVDAISVQWHWSWDESLITGVGNYQQIHGVSLINEAKHHQAIWRSCHSSVEIMTVYCSCFTLFRSDCVACKHKSRGQMLFNNKSFI